MNKVLYEQSIQEGEERLARVWELRDQNKAILDKAESENRDLTIPEAQTFDRNMRELDRIHKRGGGVYKTRRQALQKELDTPNTLAGAQQGLADNSPSYFPSDSVTNWRTSTGFNTRALDANESVHDLVEKQSSYDNEFRGLRFGDVARALATGARNEAERRALSMGSDTAGGYMVPSILSAQVIDLMRANLVVQRAGARTVPVEGGEMNIAKVVTDPVPEWRGENAAVADTDVVFGSLTLRPRVLAMVVKASRELLETAPNISSLLESTFANVMARKVDQAALIGAAEGEDTWITGVANTQDIHVIDHNAVINYDVLCKARTKLMTSNSMEPTAAILSPRDEGVISLLKDGAARPLPRPSVIDRLPIMATSSVPIQDDKGICLVGDFKRLLICPRVQLQIQVLNERFSDRLQVGYLVWLMLDIAVEEPKAFCKITNLLDIS